jgi:hypothetical protein
MRQSASFKNIKHVRRIALLIRCKKLRRLVTSNFFMEWALHANRDFRTDFMARVSRDLRLRQEEQPRPIREIAWKGQVRLCARYRQLARAGKPANVVTTAIARELSGSSGPSLAR